METKELKIQVPGGYEIDKENSTFENIVFKKVENELPKSWEELKIIKGYYADSWGDICGNEVILDNSSDNRNVFPTKEEAEACVALAQLCQLRDRYNGGWKPDWEDNSEKYIIYFHADKIISGDTYRAQSVLHFKTEELRDRFLENFEDLIWVARPLL